MLLTPRPTKDENVTLSAFLGMIDVVYLNTVMCLCDGSSSSSLQSSEDRGDKQFFFDQGIIDAGRKRLKQQQQQQEGQQTGEV